MKHELLDPLWKVRDRIAKECGYDVKRLAEMVRAEEKRCADRGVPSPIPPGRRSRGRRST